MVSIFAFISHKYLKLLYLITLLLGALSCQEASPSQLHGKVAVDGGFSELLNSITFGPEFEFDFPSNLDPEKIDKAGQIIAVHRGLREKLKSKSARFEVLENGFSFIPKDSEPLSQFFEKVSYTKESDLTAVVKREHFRIGLMPKAGNKLFDDPVWVRFTRDDVLFEVLLSPMRIYQLEKLTPIINDLVFDSMREAGLVVPKTGGGHIHIGIDAVEKFHDNIPQLDRTLFEFIKLLLFESDEFVRYFLRPQRNFAILPAMTSDFGRSSAVDMLHQWRRVENLDEIVGTNKLNYRNWFSEKVEEVTLHKYLDELRFGALSDEPFVYFQSDEKRRLDMKSFAIKPQSDLGLYPAIRYQYNYNTLELRHLSAQRQMEDFIHQARFFGGILASLSIDPSMDAKKVLSPDFSLQKFGPLYPVAMSDLAKSQAINLFQWAKIEGKEKRLAILRSMQPRLNPCR